jgi:hypothetical protein
MLEKLRNLDVIGWLKWLWTSQMGTGLIFLLVAALEKDYVIGVLASSLIVGGLAEYIDRSKHRTLRRTVFWVGIILFAAGIYLAFKNYQLSSFFHNIFKP